MAIRQLGTRLINQQQYRRPGVPVCLIRDPSEILQRFTAYSDQVLLHSGPVIASGFVTVHLEQYPENTSQGLCLLLQHVRLDRALEVCFPKYVSLGVISVESLCESVTAHQAFNESKQMWGAKQSVHALLFALTFLLCPGRAASQFSGGEG